MNSVLSPEIILVVDDDSLVREIIQQLLNTYYFNVFTAASAPEALRRFETEASYSLSDTGMPLMDRIQFIRKLGSLPSHRGGRPPLSP